MPRPQHEGARSDQAPGVFREVVLDQIQAGTLTRVWARRGSRPRRVRQNGRTSLYVLTAVCAAVGAAAGLIAPELNTGVVNLFLEQFSEQLAPGVHAVLLWDGAGYHTGKTAILAGVEPGREPRRRSSRSVTRPYLEKRK